MANSLFLQNALDQLAEISKWGQYTNQAKLPSFPQPAKSSSGGSGSSSAVGGGGSQFQKFLRAIAAQESGGNYRARSSAGALGKYQIMPANIPGWSQQAIGRRLTPSQFYNNPNLQEQVAQYMLRQYYNRYGPERAAEAWYGGPGAIGRSYVKGYSRSILRRMGLR